MLNKPIYKEISLNLIDTLKEKNVLCRVVQNSFEGLTVSHEFMNIHDKVFVMNNVDRDQINAQQMSNTGGSESMPSPEDQPQSQAEMQLPYYPNLSKTDFSNTIVSQNSNNASVVSSFSLEGNEPQATQTTEMASGPPNQTGPNNNRGTVY